VRLPQVVVARTLGTLGEISGIHVRMTMRAQSPPWSAILLPAYARAKPFSNDVLKHLHRVR
jgi:hypothetical protein